MFLPAGTAFPERQTGETEEGAWHRCSALGARAGRTPASPAGVWEVLPRRPSRSAGRALCRGAGGRPGAAPDVAVNAVTPRPPFPGPSRSSPGSRAGRFGGSVLRSSASQEGPGRPEPDPQADACRGAVGLHSAPGTLPGVSFQTWQGFEGKAEAVSSRGPPSHGPGWPRTPLKPCGSSVPRIPRGVLPGSPSHPLSPSCLCDRGSVQCGPKPVPWSRGRHCTSSTTPCCSEACSPLRATPFSSPRRRMELR